MHLIGILRNGREYKSAKFYVDWRKLLTWAFVPILVLLFKKLFILVWNNRLYLENLLYVELDKVIELLVISLK